MNAHLERRFYGATADKEIVKEPILDLPLPTPPPPGRRPRRFVNNP